MTRIFGVQRNKDEEDLSLKNKMAARIFFLRYPSLFSILLGKLHDAIYKRSDYLTVHPILIVLARLYPTNAEDEQQVYIILIYLKSNLIKHINIL